MTFKFFGILAGGDGVTAWEEVRLLYLTHIKKECFQKNCGRKLESEIVSVKLQYYVYHFDFMIRYC